MNPESKPKENTKKRKYLMIEDDLKYNFFDLHRSLKHTKLTETLTWVNKELPDMYGGALSSDMIKKWKKNFYTRPQSAPPLAEIVKKKRGQKKRELKVGEFVPWNNKRVSVATLVILATLLVAQVTAGIPLCTPMILCAANATFASAGVTWEPKISWARTVIRRAHRTVAAQGYKSCTPPPGKLSSDLALAYPSFCLARCCFWASAVFRVQHGRNWSAVYATQGQNVGCEGYQTS